MKKYLILLTLLFVSLPLLADEYAPKWEKIAPNYANVKYIENKTFAEVHPVLNCFTASSIIGLPVSIVSLNKSARIETNNYWYNRKQQFDDEIKMCEQMTSKDSKINCYIAVSQNEQNKTAQREQLLLQEKQMRINTYNAMQTQNLINNVNRPRTYYQNGNYIYSY